MRGFRVWNEREKTYDDGWDYLLSSDGGLYALKYGALVSMSGVDYLTVEFDTGLKDKNGKEIYEGDIVKWSYEIEIGVKRHTNIAIEWDTGEVSFYPYCIDSGFSLPQSEDGYEVIGNIHENKELLEGE